MINTLLVQHIRHKVISYSLNFVRLVCVHVIQRSGQCQYRSVRIRSYDLDFVVVFP